jgi:hypothetical protein
MSNWTIAEVKGQLAKLGVQLHPDAVMRTYERPANGASVDLCVVDAVSTIDGKPDCCVYGFASCISCDELCYLGSETSKVVGDLEQGVYPICLKCAATHIPSDTPPVDRLVDRARGGLVRPPV